MQETINKITIHFHDIYYTTKNSHNNLNMEIIIELFIFLFTENF
jgi:hypothetical protein